MDKMFTNSEYLVYVEKKSPNTKIGKNLVLAFIVGGIICVIGQFFSNYFTSKGLPKEMVSSLTPITMVFLGAFLTGLDIYDNIGKYAGAGSIVPISGFANSIASPAMEYKAEGQVLGVGAKMFIIAGPVLVYGISTSIVVGIIYYLLK